MADHLPDDPQHWPADPFRLLGVEPPTTEIEVKRAYTKLIRRFKPEHHPEQFRRVREAYEQALDRLKWHGAFPISFFTPSPEPERPAEPEREAGPSMPPAPESEQRRHATPRDPVEHAWELATTGFTEEAYTNLVELSRVRPDNADVALRLYWLLGVYPALDADRTRHDWLAEALKRSRLTGPAVDLYRRELDAAPEVGLFEPYFRLLDNSAPGGALLWVARQRLVAAGVSRSWTLLGSDLDTLAGRVAELDETAWLSYLVAATGQLGFDLSPAYTRCRELLAGLRHLELRESWAFDQLDEQEMMSRAWQNTHAAPTFVRDVVREAWVGPSGAWKRILRSEAAWASEDPISLLRQLDLVATFPDCRPVMNTFARLVNESPLPTGPLYPREIIRGLVREFLSKSGSGGYPRTGLLAFLVTEVIDPDELVQACIDDAGYMSRSLVEHVRNDPTLRLAWQVAMWGDR